MYLQRCSRDDCFAFDAGQCRVLSKTYKDDNDCKFFKTTEQLERDREDAYISILDRGDPELVKKFTEYKNSMDKDTLF